jgi:hypothetical protein
VFNALARAGPVAHGVRRLYALTSELSEIPSTANWLKLEYKSTCCASYKFVNAVNCTTVSRITEIPPGANFEFAFKSRNAVEPA